MTRCGNTSGRGRIHSGVKGSVVHLRGNSSCSRKGVVEPWDWTLHPRKSFSLGLLPCHRASRGPVVSLQLQPPGLTRCPPGSATCPQPSVGFPTHSSINSLHVTLQAPGSARPCTCASPVSPPSCLCFLRAPDFCSPHYCPRVGSSPSFPPKGPLAIGNTIKSYSLRDTWVAQWISTCLQPRT